jgi:Domain of unknown function (DUF4837)
MKVKINIFLLLLLFSTSACLKKSGQFIHRNITGKAGEIIVVMSKVAWDDKPGNLMRKTLAQTQFSLPQEEPLFDLVFIPHEGFKEIFHTAGNIIQAKISPIIENAGVIFADDVWAYPQATVQINARNNEEFEKLFNENSGKIIAYFLKAEQNRLVLNYYKMYEKNVYNSLEEKYSVFLKVPPGFSITSKGKDFAWIRFETPEISQVIMIYTFPYKSDSTFTLKYLIQKRDSFLMANVPGPVKGSYMATEFIAEPIFTIIRHNGNYAADVRGLWRVKNDYMGGPFIMLSELDAYRQRIVVADGYVYAPTRDKRNLIRQVEAMVYSLQFKDQEKNDKINSQLKTGN